MKLDLKILKATNNLFLRLCNLRRWTSFVSEDKYNELAKQGLNNIVTFILAVYSEESGKTVHWERFPKIALYRAFQKAYVYFDTPEHILNEICYIGNISKSAFYDVTKEIIVENTNKEFAEFLYEGIGTDELQIYRAAIKLATYIELMENRNKIDPVEFGVKTQEISESLEEFKNMPGLAEIFNPKGAIFQALEKISTLRNKNRWSVQTYLVECSVLGHLFDTAIFAYFMSLEKNPEDEILASKMFFMGIFHDVAETWTTDIPSPIKDRIPGFRVATEEYERRMLEQELYRVVPEFLSKKMQEEMFEDDTNAEFKSLIKGADYLSADSECWRQYIAGSRDDYFLGALKRRIPKINSGEVLLTPACRDLYNYFVQYAEKLNL